jgi:hypothetical protein
MGAGSPGSGTKLGVWLYRRFDGRMSGAAAWSDGSPDHETGSAHDPPALGAAALPADPVPTARCLPVRDATCRSRSSASFAVTVAVQSRAAVGRMPRIGPDRPRNRSKDQTATLRESSGKTGTGAFWTTRDSPSQPGSRSVVRSALTCRVERVLQPRQRPSRNSCDRVSASAGPRTPRAARLDVPEVGRPAQDRLRATVSRTSSTKALSSNTSPS